jgi:hypothetical protein
MCVHIPVLVPKHSSCLDIVVDVQFCVMYELRIWHKYRVIIRGFILASWQEAQK